MSDTLEVKVTATNAIINGGWSTGATTTRLVSVTADTAELIVNAVIELEVESNRKGGNFNTNRLESETTQTWQWYADNPQEELERIFRRASVMWAVEMLHEHKDDDMEQLLTNNADVELSIYE